MDLKQIKDLMLAQQTMVSGMPKDANVEGAIKAAIGNAVNKLWMAHNWFFRRAETILNTPTVNEYVDLPKDYRTFGFLEYSDGQIEGHQITYRNEDPFRKMYPNLTAQGVVRPRHVMITKTAESSKYRAVFGPRSSTSWPLGFVYFLKPGKIDDYPSGFEELLMTYSWYCLWPAGTPQKAAALLVLREELEDAIVIDQPFHNKVGSVKRETPHGFTENDNYPFDIFNYDGHGY